MGLADFFIRGVISLNGSGFSAGVRKAQVEMSGMKRSFKEIKEAVTAGFLVEASKRVIEYGSNIKDTASKISISTRELQEFTYAAKLTGGSMENIATAFRELSKSRAAALADPGGKESNIFSQLGISGAELQSSKLAVLFTRIGEKIRTTNFGQDELQIVNELFGRGAAELIPAFRQGLVGLAAEAHQLGQVMQDDVIDKLDDMGDKMEQSTTRMKVGLGSLLGWLQGKMDKVGTFWGAVSVAMSGTTGNEGLGERYAQWKHAFAVGAKALEEHWGDAPVRPNTKRNNQIFTPLADKDSGPTLRQMLGFDKRPQSTSIDRDGGVNQLQAIGAYVGSNDRVLNLLQKQVWHLASIDRKTSPESDIRF